LLLAMRIYQVTRLSVRISMANFTPPQEIFALMTSFFYSCFNTY
jgi:hypothetical protein